MLMLSFHLGNSQYAIPATEVLEIAPRVKLDPIAKVPAYIAGLFNYRGRHVPVIDLRKLIDDTCCRDSFTSRIILVQFPLARGEGTTLALLAERVTETVSIDENSFAGAGIAMPATPFLGAAARVETDLVQRISVAELLPESVQSILFPAEAG